MDEAKFSKSAISIGSMDDEIKTLQRDKLAAEIRQLKGLSFESMAKLAAAALGIAAAVWAIWIGALTSQLNLIETREKVADKAMQLKALESELILNQEANNDLEARRARIADDYSRLQETLLLLEAQAQKLKSTVNEPAARELKEKFAEATKPIVLVQFAGELNREAIIYPLLERLKRDGFNAPGAERVNRGQSNEVRFFANTEADRELSKKIVGTAISYFKEIGCPLPSLTAKLTERKDGKQSPPELWLMHGCSRTPQVN